MATNLKMLCRLCAQPYPILKDLYHESNIKTLKMVQDYIHITICENDALPTKICLECEEKIVRFQLFVLECYKVQDTLQNIQLNNCEELPAGGEYLMNVPDIKQEIKHEISNEAIGEIKIEEPNSELDDEIYDSVNVLDHENFDENENLDDNEDYDENDNSDHKSDSEDSETIDLASLREAKHKEPQKREMTEEQKQKLKILCQTPNAKISDFVQMKCEYCPDSFKVWGRLQVHCKKFHKKPTFAYCICGFVVRSKTSLYRHILEHKKKERAKTNLNNIKASDLIKFFCEKCYKEFSSWYKLEKHFDRRHRSNPTVRCSCGVILNSRTVMYKHVRDHKENNVIRCPMCPKTAKTVEEIEKHKLRHIPKSERRFQCSSCDKLFSSKECLRSHEKSHIPIEQRKIYHCDICNDKFTTRASAASHKRVVHEKIKSYVCDLCGYACGTSGELRQHRAIHSDVKPFSCTKCSKAFKTYSNLKTHMDTHEDTSYVCYVCNRVLNSRRTLRKHLLVHDDKCTHVCTYCNKAFKRRQTLKVHLSMHTGDKPLSCKWCDEKFSYASTLRSHRLRVHPDKVNVHYAAYPAPLQQEYMKNDEAAIVTKVDV